MLRTDKVINNEHPKYEKLKENVVEKVKVANISQMDIEASRLKSYASKGLDKDKLVNDNKSLLQTTLKDKAESTLETTGKFKKD